MSTISMKAVTALRTYADAMPVAINKMKESNAKLLAAFQSVREEVGPRDDAIFAAINAVQKFQEESAEPIAYLQPKLEEKADEVAAYIAAQFGGGGQNP